MHGSFDDFSAVSARGGGFAAHSRGNDPAARRLCRRPRLGAGVGRGPSVHRKHTDAVIALAGELGIGLRDLRERSPVFRQPFRLALSPREPVLVWIPPGVMHAFYAATEPALVLVGNTHEYDPDDDIKCRWQDAPLDLDDSVLGTQDDRARPLDEVIAALRALS